MAQQARVETAMAYNQNKRKRKEMPLLGSGLSPAKNWSLSIDRVFAQDMAALRCFVLRSRGRCPCGVIGRLPHGPPERTGDDHPARTFRARLGRG